MIEKNSSQQWHPHIVAIGKLTGSLKAYHSEEKYLKKKDDNEAPLLTCPPSSFVSQSGILSVIDQKGNLWVVGNIFYEPVNLTDFIKTKAKTVFLGEGQLLFQNRKKDLILITWASKPEFPAEKLNKIPIADGTWSNLIQAYYVCDQGEEGSIWQYSTVKKLQNTIKLYHLNKITKEIIGLPLKKKMSVPSSPAGLSLGKYHGLIWTEDGRLFAWGSKNLGLGLSYYDKSYYDELQQIVLPQPIIKAYAGINYSIALTNSGKLYEWGCNSKNEMIVTPRILNMKGLKFVNIKGFLNIIGGLTSENKFYAWGKGVQNILSELIDKQIDEPFQVKKQENAKILDFQIQQNYIIFMVSQDNGTLSHDEKQYFAEVITKVNIKWLPHRAKAKIIQGAKTQETRSPVCTPPELIKRSNDFIDRLVSEHINKENYFNQIQNQQKFYKKLMAQSNSQTIVKFQNNFLYKIKQPSMTPKLTKRTHKKFFTTKDPSILAFDIENTSKFIKDMQTSIKKEQASVQRIKKMTKSKKQVKQVKQVKQITTDIRNTKKRTIFLKVQDIQLSHSKTCTQLSTQKRLNTKRNLNQSEEFLQNSSFQMQKIAETFNKVLLMKFLMQVVSNGKNIKIKQLKKKLSADKLNYSFNGYAKKKIHFTNLSDLQVQNPKKYNKVTNLLRKAMRNWKTIKIQNESHRKTIVNFIVKSVLKKKLKEGLGSVWLKARKLKKVATWIVAEQKQRILQIKSLWKKWLLLYIKPTPTFENKRPSVCREQLNIKPTVQKGKHIKFAQFIRKSPIFKLRLLYPVSIHRLQNQQFLAHIYARHQVDYPCSKKGVSWAQKHFTQSKFQFTQRDFDKKSTHSTGVIDILPYSYHYNSYFKPKNYQINIPDNMKQSEKWISQERRILDDILKDYTRTQWKQFCLNKRDYQTKLAFFIRDNYDYLAQYRWKFIIEYNKISQQQPNKVKKKQDELLRLLKKIGAQSILKNDVIPQKHKILQYVSLLKGSPTMPQLQTKLTQLEFKRLFKIYYEQISTKSKTFRKFFN